MDFQLRDYQRECLETIDNKLKSGEKYLSVVMTTGLGIKITSLFLANKLITEEQVKVVMVFRYKAALMQVKTEAKRLGINHVRYVIVRDFVNNADEYQYVILHDLYVFDRKQTLKCIKDKGTRAISFFSPSQELVEEDSNTTMLQRIMVYAERLSPVVSVYVTNEVLDIRDAKYAGETEIVYVSQKNMKTANCLQQERIQTIHERDEIKKCKDRLQAYMKAIRQAQNQQKIKEQKAEIEKLKALLQADEKDKEIEELRDRETEYQKQIEEKDARIAQQNQMIIFLKDILSSFRINKEIIQDSFHKILNIREALKSDLESNDNDVREIAVKQLQDKVAKMVSGLTQDALSLKDKKYFEDYLIGELTEDVWQRLDSSSKTFLTTAKSNYESMVNMKESETFDYSGVCLLVTKAVEVETTKRFFLCYKDYLERKYSSVSQWPYALRQWNRGQITENVITDNNFTLGSVVSVIGLKRNYDDYGNIVAYQVGHAETKNEFLKYAENDLFKYSDRRRVEAEIEKDYHFIEKVRLDYRNPSAHRDRITMTSAKECLEYVIDVHHMLKEMLSEMKI